MRRIPRNPDCPLTKQERANLIKKLEDIEAHYYLPFKRHSGGFSTARVYDYDEETIRIEVKFGVDGSVTYEEEEMIDRSELFSDVQADLEAQDSKFGKHKI